jgi:hypothetical protein
MTLTAAFAPDDPGINSGPILISIAPHGNGRRGREADLLDAQINFLLSFEILKTILNQNNAPAMFRVLTSTLSN